MTTFGVCVCIHIYYFLLISIIHKDRDMEDVVYREEQSG